MLEGLAFAAAAPPAIGETEVPGWQPVVHESDAISNSISNSRIIELLLSDQACRPGQ
jgi:hypothetical protein